MAWDFRSETAGETTYLIMDLKEGMKVDYFALKMLEHNAITNIIPSGMIHYNNSDSFQFSISGLNSLNQRLQDTLSKKEVLYILNGIVTAFEEAEAYMLGEEGFLLDCEYIYLDKQDNCYLMYLPLLLEKTSDIISFLQHLVGMIRPNYTEKDPYIYNIMNTFSRGAIKKLSDFKETLRKVGMEPVLCTEKERKKYTDIETVQFMQESDMNIEASKPITVDKSSAKEKTQTSAKIPVLNIPGKGSVPINIPLAEDRKNAVDIIKKEKTQTEESEKKKKEWNPFAKKGNERNETDRKKTETPIDDKCKNDNEEMYESYEETIIMESFSPCVERETVLLKDGMPIVELIRKRNGSHIWLQDKTNMLGSEMGVNCYIGDNRAISRQHAIITIEEGHCYIVDNHSSNGTFVNGRRLVPGETEELYNHMMIRLANEDFEFFSR